jgi:MFS family permease
VTLPLSSPGRRLIGAYAELPAISGPSFLPISFFGRLPSTMAPLAILTLAASSTGSFAAAGLATTATAAGTAVGAPLMGRLADRYGQRPVLSASVLINTLALAGLALHPGTGRVGLLALCALIGLSMPPVGGMARARWLALSRRHSGTAMAYEGTADEVAFVVGPAATGLLASTWGAPSALLAAAAAGLVAAGAFALHPTHAAARIGDLQQRAEMSGRQRPDRLMLLGPVLGMVLMGAFFAASQTALTAVLTSFGRPATAGLIYALMAVGSAVTALGVAVVPARFGPRSRCAVAASGLLVGVLMMATAGSLPALCAGVLFTGLSVGPTLVTLHQVAGAAAVAGRTATTMGYLSAGSVSGIALGATTAGALADASGGTVAFAVAATASAGLLVLALTVLPRSRVTAPAP